MSLFFAIVAYLLYLYVVLIVARVVIEIIRQFARSWRPAGIAAVGIEAVYVVTDPPLRVLRKIVPPLRLGGVSLDLSVIILLLAILGLERIALSLS